MDVKQTFCCLSVGLFPSIIVTALLWQHHTKKEPLSRQGSQRTEKMGGLSPGQVGKDTLKAGEGGRLKMGSQKEDRKCISRACVQASSITSQITPAPSWVDKSFRSHSKRSDLFHFGFPRGASPFCTCLLLLWPILSTKGADKGGGCLSPPGTSLLLQKRYGKRKE